MLETTQEMLKKSNQQFDKVKEYDEPLLKSRQRVEMQKHSISDLKNSLNNTGNKDNEINIKLREFQSKSKKCRYILLQFLN